MELKEQFLPTNSSWAAQEASCNLRQIDSLETVKEFSSLMLDVTRMSELDKLFNFMRELKSWTQLELRRQ